MNIGLDPRLQMCKDLQIYKESLETHTRASTQFFYASTTFILCLVSTSTKKFLNRKEIANVPEDDTKNRRCVFSSAHSFSLSTVDKFSGEEAVPLTFLVTRTFSLFKFPFTSWFAFVATISTSVVFLLSVNPILIEFRAL